MSKHTMQAQVCHQWSPQLQTPSLKWWKRFVSLTIISLPTILEMNLEGIWQSPHIQRFLFIQIDLVGKVLIRPKDIICLSLWLQRMYFFYSSSIFWSTNFVSGTYPTSFICLAKLFNNEYISCQCWCVRSST